MAQSRKLTAGAAFPKLAWPTIGGGTLDIAAMPGWRLLAVYRGKHCPLCKRYFKTLDGLLDDFKAAGVAVAAVSADPKEKAEADVAEQAWRFPVGYGLTIEQMRTLGLYISDPRSPQETDRPFAEPGLFLVNPQPPLPRRLLRGESWFEAHRNRLPQQNLHELSVRGTAAIPSGYRGTCSVPDQQPDREKMTQLRHLSEQQDDAAGSPLQLP
jgi:hypothetical protein